jgi:carboxymethylenebutenolidase
MPEGQARAIAFTPDHGRGPWPAVILYMDALAIRPALCEMGERLAKAGYYVLIPDLYWRFGSYEPIDLTAFDEKRREEFVKMMGSTDPEKQMNDTGGCLAWLATQAQAKADQVGVTGYCMGGSVALRAAGTFPDRIVAAASFHGGNLATDDETSPHRFAPKIKARILVAGADEDQHFDKAQCERLSQALSDAGADADVSIWEGFRHGWVPSDVPAHDPAGAERHWNELIALFDETLKQKSNA